MCQGFFFLNITNKVLSWNYFHFVLTKGMGKIHQLMQGCIMIKTKEINPSFILKRQYKSFFLYWPLMSFPPWIHLKHFSLMNGICYYEVSFVSSLASRNWQLQYLHDPLCSVLQESLLVSASQLFSSICPVSIWRSSDNSACIKASLCFYKSLSITT